MKKIVATMVLGASLFTSVASADFSRIEMGAGLWQQTPNGTSSYTDASVTGTYTSHKKEDNSAYVWLLIKHPLPIIPNLRLEYTDIHDSGDIKGTFKDFSIPAGSVTTATLDLKQYDIIPYYNLLDNTFWITLDLGLDIKVQQSKLNVQPIVGVYEGYNDTTTVAIPMIYARTRVELPFDIGVEGDIKYITYQGSTVYDARAKVDYTFDFVPLIQPAIEVGYRVQKFDVTSDDDKTKVNMDFKGFYAGLMLRF